MVRSPVQLLSSRSRPRRVKDGRVHKQLQYFGKDFKLHFGYSLWKRAIKKTFFCLVQVWWNLVRLYYPWVLQSHQVSSNWDQTQKSFINSPFSKTSRQFCIRNAMSTLVFYTLCCTWLATIVIIQKRTSKARLALFLITPILLILVLKCPNLQLLCKKN